MLKVENIDVLYQQIQAIWNVSLEVQTGEIVSLVGSNGSGKTTTLKTIAGLLKSFSGQILFEGERIGPLPAHEVAARGLVLVPEGRGLFPYMSVLDNLELGSYAKRSRLNRKHHLQKVLDMLPVLGGKRDVLCNSLSGGEQQMVAIGRGLMANPKLLMLDEPSLGLSPMIVKTVFQTILEIKKQGVTLLIVEQNVRLSLKSSDRGYVLESGRIVLEGLSGDLLKSGDLKKAYLGESDN